MLFYVEFRNGNCTIVAALDGQEAKEKARDARFGAITLVREATEDDKLHFTGQGGMVR